MSGGSNPKQVATPASPKAGQPGRVTSFNSTPATPAPSYGGGDAQLASNAFSNFQRDASIVSPQGISPEAIMAAQRNAASQQINTSGPQLGQVIAGQAGLQGSQPGPYSQSAQSDYMAQYSQPASMAQQGLLGPVPSAPSVNLGRGGAVPPPGMMYGPNDRLVPIPGGQMGGQTQAAVMPAPQVPAAPAQPNIFQQSAGAYTGAINAANAAAAFQPQQVGTNFGYTPDALTAERVGTTFGYDPQQVAAQAALGGIQQYFNPYEQQVIEGSMGDLERQRMRQMAQMGAQATAARAFGGSRQGVAQALTNEAFAQQGGQLASQLRAQGFQTALGASQQDVANQLQASLANQGAFARSQEFGQSTTLQAQQANQAAALQAAQANQAARAAAAQFGQSTGLQAQLANQSAGLSAAGLRAGAAGQLGGLSQQGFNMGQNITQQQMQQGAMQQAINQALISAGQNQYGGFTGAPGQSLNATLAALGGANMGQQTQTITQQPGLFNYLSLGLGALSDIRLKDDIKPAGEVGGVRFYTWNWNETGKRLADPKQPTFGVIADEVAVSHPQHVSRGADGYLRVNYAGLIGELRAA